MGASGTWHEVQLWQKGVKRYKHIDNIGDIWGVTPSVVKTTRTYMVLKLQGLKEGDSHCCPTWFRTYRIQFANGAATMIESDALPFSDIR